MSDRKVLIAKADSAEHITDRIKRGADGIEIQLLDRKGVKKLTIEDVKENIDKFSAVTSVHSALSDSIGEVDIAFASEESNGYLYEAFEIAEFIGKHFGRHVGVVIHNTFTLNEYMNLDILSFTINMIRTVLDRYPDTDLFIENGAPAKTHESFAEGMAAFFEKLAGIFKFGYDKRVFFLLDTCHAMISSDFWAYANEDRNLFDTEYRKYFELFGPYCKEIHLSDKKGAGIIKGHHGIPFEKYDFGSEARFDTTMHYIEKYMTNATICLEVPEKDYDHAENFSKMKEMVDNWKR